MNYTERQLYVKSVLDTESTIRTWRFMWKFPFIKIVDYTGTLKDFQDILNKQMNIIIDNRKHYRVPRIFVKK